MGEVVSFSKAKKARDKAQAKAHARENRVKFGRTKAQKVFEKTQAESAERTLDGARRDDAED